MNKELKDKLYNYEAAPPAASWNAISRELDEALATSTIGSKLNLLEVQPPFGAWAAISSSLDNSIPDTTQVRKLNPFLRYAAAAAIIAFLAWGGITLFNKPSATDVAETPKPEPSKNSQPSIPVAPVNEEQPLAVITEVEARNDAALEASKKTYASVSTKAARERLNRAADFYFTVPEESNYPTGTTRGLSFEDPEEQPNLSNRYIMLLTPDGNLIRMSKKLSDLVCCVSGEVDDQMCNDQMKRWREKLASPATTHSPADFMDILSLIKSL